MEGLKKMITMSHTRTKNARTKDTQRRTLDGRTEKMITMSHTQTKNDYDESYTYVIVRWGHHIHGF